MNKNLIIIICLIACAVSGIAGNHPEAHFGKYGLEHLPDAQAYEKYIGETVIYLTERVPTYDDGLFTEMYKGKPGVEYIIKAVEGNDKMIIFKMVEKYAPGSKIKFKFENFPDQYYYDEKTFCNTEEYRVPLFFVDKFKEDSINFIPTSLRVQGNIEFPVKGIRMKYPTKGYPQPSYEIENTLIGEPRTVPVCDIDFFSKTVGTVFSNTEFDLTYSIVDLKKDYDAELTNYQYSILNSSTGKIDTFIQSIDGFGKISGISPTEYVNQKYTEAKEASIIGSKYTDSLCNFTYTVVGFDKEVDSASVASAYTFILLNSGTNNRETVVRKVDSKGNITCSFPEEYANQKFKEAREGHYLVTLSKVEKPTNPNIRSGKIDIVNVEDNAISSYVDNVIDITVMAAYNNIKFNIKNLSSNTIKLIWDEAVFIDESGTSSKVMHTGTTYENRYSSQPPTIIIKDAKIEEVVYPTNNVFYSEAMNDWIHETILPSEPFLENQQIKLMLPIQIKDVVNEYIFIFNLKYVPLHPELLNISE